MATAPAKDPSVTVKPARSGGLKRILLLVGVALVAAGGAGAAVYFLVPRPGVAHQAQAAPPAAAPTFFALDPFTVNLQSDDGAQHYLRIGLSLKLTDPHAQAQITEHMPELRSRILLLLTNKKPEELSTLEGKRMLAAELRGIITEPTDSGQPPARVDQVLFTDFVIQ
jgi:flagellar protein FliL